MYTLMNATLTAGAFAAVALAARRYYLLSYSSEHVGGKKNGSTPFKSDKRTKAALSAAGKVTVSAASSLAAQELVPDMPPEGSTSPSKSKSKKAKKSKKDVSSGAEDKAAETSKAAKDSVAPSGGKGAKAKSQVAAVEAAPAVAPQESKSKKAKAKAAKAKAAEVQQQNDGVAAEAETKKRSPVDEADEDLDLGVLLGRGASKKVIAVEPVVSKKKSAVDTNGNSNGDAQAANGHSNGKGKKGGEGGATVASDGPAHTGQEGVDDGWTTVKGRGSRGGGSKEVPAQEPVIPTVVPEAVPELAPTPVVAAEIRPEPSLPAEPEAAFEPVASKKKKKKKNASTSEASTDAASLPNTAVHAAKMENDIMAEQAEEAEEDDGWTTVVGKGSGKGKGGGRASSSNGAAHAASDVTAAPVSNQGRAAVTKANMMTVLATEVEEVEAVVAPSSTGDESSTMQSEANGSAGVSRKARRKANARARENVPLPA